jgi:acetyl esterase/lipase
VAVRIEPREWLVDEVPRITVDGLRPDTTVRIDAYETDATDQRWASWATFRADSAGIAGLDQPAIAGTYTGRDASGLFWSMRAATDGTMYRARSDHVVTTFEVSVDDGVVARGEGRRVFAGPGVRRSEVDDDGLRGVLFEPAEPNGLAVMTVQGSGGGVNEGEVALLASRGFTAFSLAHFNYPGRPAVLLNAPLEYFEAAGRWLGERPGVRAERCILSGQSRGGELVLLLAATFPKLFGPIVAIVPSSQLWGGMGASGSAWTRAGEPLPYMTTNTGERVPADLPRPVALTPLFERAMQDDERVNATTIEIERAESPILMLSGAADAMWPSSSFSDRLMSRLSQQGYRWSYRHVMYPDAGHLVGGIPNTPVVTHSIHPVAHTDFAFGGSIPGTAAARSDSWALRLSFMRDAAPEPLSAQGARSRATR